MVKMTNNSKEAKVKTEKIKSLLTCPICNKIFKDATAIRECLHIFCRKCIYKKITEEELHRCPVCSIDLGCSPLEKLRADHNWQDVGAKILASIRKQAKEHEAAKAEFKEPEYAKREAKELEIAPSIPLLTRRKERSLSSLVNMPKISNQTSVSGRRKPSTRKAPPSQGSTVFNEEPVEKAEDHSNSSSCPITLSNYSQNRKQNASAAESSFKQQMPDRGTLEGGESLEGMNDLWKPLNSLVGAVGIEKPKKSNSNGYAAKSTSFNLHQDEENVLKAINNEWRNDSKALYDEKGSTPASSGLIKPRKMLRRRQKRTVPSERLSVPAEAVVGAVNSKCERRINPIWFSLIASDDQEGDPPLPQIPSCYLMIKDVNLPVSFIQKYLMQKLDLDSEAEVEIGLLGQPLLPNLQLHNLIDLWSHMAPTSERVATSVGSSAKDFVMILSYGRKAQPS